MSTDPRKHAQRIADAAPAIISGLEAAIEAMHEPRRQWWHWLLPGLWTLQWRHFEKWRHAHRLDVAEAEALLDKYYSEDEWGEPVLPRPPRPPRTPHS